MCFFSYRFWFKTMQEKMAAQSPCITEHEKMDCQSWQYHPRQHTHGQTAAHSWRANPSLPHGDPSQGLTRPKPGLDFNAWKEGKAAQRAMQASSAATQPEKKSQISSTSAQPVQRQATSKDNAQLPKSPKHNHCKTIFFSNFFYFGIYLIKISNIHNS